MTPSDPQPLERSASAHDLPSGAPFNRRRTALLPRWLQAIPPATPRNLWLLLAALVALQNCIVFHTAQLDRFALLAVVVWGGALICLEDQLEGLRPRPAWFGLFFGTPLLLWVLARTAVMVSVDNMLFLIAPLAGLALTLLCLPPGQLHRFRDPLLCLLLLPGFRVVGLLFPDGPTSLVTAQVVGFWLSSLGLDVLVHGRAVILPGGAVEVASSCNGFEIIAQLICIAVVFLLAFPLRSWIGRILLVLSAALIGFLSNTIRIALLAVFAAMGPGTGAAIFRFFHDDAGSLLFAGLAVFVFGALYLNCLERELALLASAGDQE